MDVRSNAGMGVPSALSTFLPCKRGIVYFLSTYRNVFSVTHYLESAFSSNCFA